MATKTRKSALKYYQQTTISVTTEHDGGVVCDTGGQAAGEMEWAGTGVPAAGP